MTTQKIGSGLASIRAHRDHLNALVILLDTRLAPRISPEISARSTGVTVSNLSFIPEGRALKSVVCGSDSGSGHSYVTRITFDPAGHHCTCPDWAQRHRACKHVGALMSEAVAALKVGIGSLDKKIEAFDTRIAGLRADIAAVNQALEVFSLPTV